MNTKRNGDFARKPLKRRVSHKFGESCDSKGSAETGEFGGGGVNMETP